MQLNSTAASPIEFIEFDAAQYAQWESFLDAAEQEGHSTLYHRTAWDRVWRSYGLHVIRLGAVERGQVIGVLPLVHQKSMLFGNHLVSLPWFDAAGVLDTSSAARDALIQAACTCAGRLGAEHVHLRQLNSFECTSAARTDKVLMQLALPSDPEVLWKSFSPKVRNQVRKAEKSGLSVQTGGTELVGDFFDIYSVNMRDLGSPSHSQRFLEAILEQFPQNTRISVVRLEGRPVGAGLTLADNDTLEIPWASSLRRYNALCVNHQLYWSILRQACTDNFRKFHFGRSTEGSGTYRFKRQWGAEPHTLHWYTMDAQSGEFLAAERSEESFGAARRLWTRLPTWLSRQLGPRIIRHLA